jgi:peptidoglycan DL-endopeptidase CwlO
VVKRVEPGGSLLPERILAHRYPHRARRALLTPTPPPRPWRVSRVAAAAVAALLAACWAWPGVASAASQGTNPAPPEWLLSRSVPATLPVPGREPRLPTVAPLRQLMPADLAAVSATTLPAHALAAIRRLHGVRAAEAVDAARVQVNGRFVAMLGVDPSQFRRFAAKPTARHTAFWRSVAAGMVGISYTMGKQGKLPPGSSAVVAGRHIETLPVGQLGTVGIGGIDAVISDAVARSLGFPQHNAFVISAARTSNWSALAKRIRKLLPHSAAVEVIAAQPVTGGSGPATTPPPGQPSISGLVTLTQVRAMLSAALSRVGDPYIWGAAGPDAFDCSGLVQWSFAQAGVVMPRVAADQARTGLAVPVSQLQPGDLLFYHTDPTAPGYISHVAIYLGGGRMIQAPQAGMNVEVVPVDLGSGFAGAIDVSPSTAAQVAATSV